MAKIVALLHDPPAKPIFFRPYSGGHTKLAKSIMDIVCGKKTPHRFYIADYMSSGMDRPVLNRSRKKDWWPRIQYFHKDFLITHPLDQARLTLPFPGEREKVTTEDIETLRAFQQEAAGTLAQLDQEPTAEELRRVFLFFWRLFRQEIVKKNPNQAALWQFMPADSRCPDHSIWEHNRMTSALAFVNKPVQAGSEQKPNFPWLFSFALRPVQEFLAQARKSQDLWIGSMLLAELSLAAMIPIIETYGPDTIVYPDLRENPRADQYFSVLEQIPDIKA